MPVLHHGIVGKLLPIFILDTGKHILGQKLIAEKGCITSVSALFAMIKTIIRDKYINHFCYVFLFNYTTVDQASDSMKGPGIKF